jgi:MFS family permease
VVTGPTAALVVVAPTLLEAFPAGLPGRVAFAALAVALLGLSATIPTLAAAVFSGTLADRVDRRRLMQWVNLLATLALVLADLVLLIRPAARIPLPGPTGFYLPVWGLLLFPLWAALTTAVTVFRPTFNASLPNLVSADELGVANGLIAGVTVAVAVGAWVSAGVLFDHWGPAVALMLPIALFVAAQYFLAVLAPSLPRPKAPPKRAFLEDAAEGYRYIARRRELLALTVGALAINFFTAVAFVELPLYVYRALGLDATFYGILLAGSSVGAGIGALGVNRLGFERRAGVMLALFAALQGLCVVAFGLQRSWEVAFAAMFCFGLFPGMFQTAFLASVQATVPSDRLGRVFAADEVGSFAMIPVGQYAGGLAVLALGLSPTYVYAGLGTIAVGAGLALVPSLRRFGFVPERHAPVPSEPARAVGSAEPSPIPAGAFGRPSSPEAAEASGGATR